MKNQALELSNTPIYNVIYNRHTNHYQQFDSKTYHELGSILNYGFWEENSPWHFLKFMMPADVLFIQKTCKLYFKLIDNLPKEERMHYQLRFDICLNHPESYCYRLIHQAKVIALDAYDMPWLFECEHELIGKPASYSPARYCLRHTVSNEYSYFPELPQPDYEQLTKQELEILKLSSLGQSTDNISDTLCISPHTVSKHKQNIIRKTGTHNILHAVIYATKLKLI